MRDRILWTLNGVLFLVTLVALLFHFSNPPKTAEYTINGELAATQPIPRDLLFLSSSNSADTFVQIRSRSLAEQSWLTMADSNTDILSTQTPPPTCDLDQLYPSGNGRYLLSQYNCHDNTYSHLLDLTDTSKAPLIVTNGYFLDWSPDGNWFLFRHTNTEELWLIQATDGAKQTINTPFGTYGAIFSPDGQTLTTASSSGLGFGSTLGQYNLLTHTYHALHHTDQIIASPRWAPNGQHLAYILLPDSNVPFPTAELWLADATGQPGTFISQVDGGRGYPPAWSPDSQQLTFVYRENPDDNMADQHARALHSNLYQVNLATGAITQRTQFNETHLYDIAWSPDGTQMAFTANDAVWVLNTGDTTPVKLNHSGQARHPAWLVEPLDPQIP